MATVNLDGCITRRGFIELSSAALAGAWLMGNANAGKFPPSAEATAETANPDAGPMVGKIAIEEHFVLAENIDTNYAVRDLPPETRHKIVDLGSGRIAEMGTHRDLAADRGLYFDLVRNQLEIGA